MRSSLRTGATASRSSTMVANKACAASAKSAFRSAARMRNPRSAVWSKVSCILRCYRAATSGDRWQTGSFADKRLMVGVPRSPEAGHAVGVEFGIDTDEQDAFDERLGDKQTVERILVMVVHCRQESCVPRLDV